MHKALDHSSWGCGVKAVVRGGEVGNVTSAAITDGFSRIVSGWPTARVEPDQIGLKRRLPERLTYLLSYNLAKDVIGGLLLGRAAHGSYAS